MKFTVWISSIVRIRHNVVTKHSDKLVSFAYNDEMKEANVNRKFSNGDMLTYRMRLELNVSVALLMMRHVDDSCRYFKYRTWY